MSVAVSPYLPPAQGLGFNSGQQGDLLDALLASCQKSTTNPRLPSWGRTLHPYFPSEDLIPRKSVNSSPSAVGVPKGKGKQKKSKARLIGSSASSGSDEETVISTSRSPLNNFQTQLSGGKSSPPHAKPIPKQQWKSGSAVVPVWAGPSFGIAPAASEIPTPSDFLLA